MNQEHLSLVCKQKHMLKVELYLTISEPCTFCNFQGTSKESFSKCYHPVVHNISSIFKDGISP